MIRLVEEDVQVEPTRLVSEDEADDIYASIARKLRGLAPHIMPDVVVGLNKVLRHHGCEAVVIRRVEVVGVQATSTGNRLAMLVNRRGAP